MGRTFWIGLGVIVGIVALILVADMNDNDVADELGDAVDAAGESVENGVQEVKAEI